MKNFKHLLFMVLCLCCITASAFEVDGIAYTITTSSGSSDYTVSVTSKSTKYEGDITIPSSVTYEGVTYHVTGIGANAFADGFVNSTSLKSITLPSSITSIGANAFYCCLGLTTIEIPSGVTSIGHWAFDGCINLATVVNKSSLPISAGSNSYGKVGYYASYVVSSISSYNGYKYIYYDNKYYVVDYIGNSQSLTLPTYLNGSNISTYYIGRSAFCHKTTVTSVTLPTSIYGIGENAFSGCTNLKSLSIGSNVASIGSSAFYDCTSLESIEYNAKSVSSLNFGNNIFYNAGKNSTKGITVNFGSSVTSIPQYLFGGSSSSLYAPNITGANIPSSVTSIGSNAFYNCNNLKTVINNSSLSLTAGNSSNGYVAYYAKKVYSGGSFLNYNDYRFVYSGSTYYMDSYYGTDADLELPNGYGSSSYSYIIGKNIFYNNTKLKSVLIPAKVKEIEDNAFYGCSNLKTVLNNSSLELTAGSTTNGYVAYYAKKVYSNGAFLNYGDYRFVYSGGTYYIVSYDGTDTELVLPNGYGSFSYKVGAYAFYYNPKIISVFIPDKVTSIEDKAFYGCSNLKTVMNNSSLDLTAGAMTNGYVAYYASNVFKNTTGQIYASGDYKFLQADGVWNLIGYTGSDKQLVLPNDYNGNSYVVAGSAFSGESSIRSVVIPNTITTIEAKAFYNCSNLASVTIGTNVTSIGDYAFYTGDKLSKVYLLPSEVPAGIDKAFSAGTGTSYNNAFVSFVPNSNYSSKYLGSKYVYSNISSKFSVDGVVFVPITASTCDAIDFDYANMPKNLVIRENVTYRNRSLAVQNIRNHFMEGNDSLLTVNVNNSGPIGGYAFSKCTNLTTADVSAASSIGTNLFEGCGKLTDVVLPATLTSIPNYTFRSCSALRTLNIPQTVKTIGSSTFESSGLNEITLPTELTSIGDKSFRYTKLTRIDLPTTLTDLGSAAFSDCTLLEEISIPSGITKLNSLTFSGCTKLTTFTIPENVTYIDYGCFNGCSALTNLRIEDSDNVLTINRNYSTYPTYSFCPNLLDVYIGRSISILNNSYEDAPFYNNMNLKEVVIGDKVKTLPKAMFRNCSNIERVTIGTQLQNISEYMFYGCSKLTTINIPSSVTSIGYWAFNNCSMLNSIELPAGLTEISDNTFRGCSKLESMKLPSGVKKIGKYAFYNCSLLGIVNIPTGVTEIGDYAFYGCTSLNRFNIPAGIKTIAENTFTNCTALKELTFADSEDALTFNCKVASLPIDSLYIGRNLTYTTSPFKGMKSLKSLTLGEKCTEVGVDFVANCSNLSNINLSNIVSMGKSAFQNCSAATRIDLPESLTTIGDYALAGCTQLEDINISDSISVLPDSIVSGCTALKNFKIPAKVSDVSSSLLSTLTNLETLSIPDSRNPLKITGSNALFANTKIDSAYIGRDFTAEKSPLYNSKTIRKVVFGNNVKTLQANYFYGCNKLEDLTLPKTLTHVGNNAFYGCNKVTKMALPKSITTVGTNAFDGCSALKYVEIESGQSPLAFNADFDDCTLDSIYVGRNLTGNTIPVKGKTSLKSYKTSAYVTTLPENALSGCTSLTDLWLGKRVESLGKNALLNCTAIETIKSYNSAAPVCASGVLSNIDKWGTTLYVPTTALPVYEAADQWKDFFFIEGMDLADNTIVTQPTANSPRVVMAYPNTGEKYQWYMKSTVLENETVETVKTETIDLNSKVASSGSYAWTKTGNTWKSGNKGVDSSTSTMTLSNTYEVGDTLKFDWTVSSESGYDKLNCKLGSETIVSDKSGTTSGTYSKVFTSPQTVTLTCTYTKDGSQSSGNDCATISLYPVIRKTIEAHDVAASSGMVPVTGGTTSSLSPMQISVGDTVYCEITLPDGEILYTDTVKITDFADSKTITFMVGNVVYKTEQLSVGSPILLPESPTKEGYTFIGWDNLPETMPDEDIVVTAIFKANTYILTYIVDGEPYKNVEYDCDSTITPEAAPVKTGKTFVEWNGMVEKMPARNLTVTAVYTENTCVVYNGNSTSINAVYTSLSEKPEVATASNALVFADDIINDTAGANFVMKNEDGNWQANSIVITDAQPFYSPYDVEAANITYTRNFKNTGWQPLYIPFSMEYDDWKDVVKVAYIVVP